ncbi:pilus assembly protein PilP [Neisseria iguanae]|uniref:Pilin assembly protein n=1 Tax=Neisseria iguanae TaxID=90242 RepID=A0A2P7U1X9_9NEIS|nr:pilus assembly protein PilP [Neisseria iguanae]PSJ80976.1 pilin assembly protein [Neisseria iguanae]
MKNTILLLGVLNIAACTPTYNDLSQWMTQTRADAKKHIIPFEEPTVTPPKVYIPPSYSGPNAFDSRRLKTLTARTSNAPNLSRTKETLEAFSLENLRYVGSLRSSNRISGFIQAENHVYTVVPGNYIGQNYGKIQRITEDKIVITEMVEDSYGNWIYRTAELPLNSQPDSNNLLQTTAPVDENTVLVTN